MASRIKGITIEIDGNATKLQAALQSVNTSLGNTKGALSDVNRLLKLDPSNTELLRQKQTYLAQAIDETEEKLKQERDALRQLEEAGKTSDNQEQQRALRREIEATEQSLKNFKKQAADASSVFGAKMQVAGQKMQDVGKKISGVGRSLSMYVTAPLAGIGAAAVKVTADFDESMSKVQALSGATGEEFNQLRDLAREMGATTKYSAAEAADGLGYMALAGWDTKQMVEGLPGILDLAAASGMELADASDLVTDYLTAFGLEASYAGKMADELAYAQANSNTTTTELGEAFQNSAVSMNSAGQSLETTTALLGVMANSGLKGARAGTALNATMRDITQHMKNGAIQIGDTTIAVQDQNGNFRDLVDILADVEKATYGMGTAERDAALGMTFTDRSAKAVKATLDQGTDSVYEFRNALEHSDGAARSMAEIMQDNLAGELTKLKSALQEVAISLGDSLVPMIRKGVEFIQGLVDKFNSLDEKTKENIVKFGLLAAAIGPVLTAVGTMTSGVGALTSGIGKVVTKLTGMADGLGGIPFSPVTLAIMGVVGALGLLKVSTDMQEEAYRNANRSAYDAIDASEEVRKQMEKTGEQIGTAFDTADESIANAAERAEMASSMVDRLEELVSAEQLSNSEMVEAQGIVAQLNALYPGMNAQIDENGNLLGRSTEEMRGFIDNALEVATVEAKQQALKESMQELTDAVTAKVEAQVREKQVTEELEKAETSYKDAVEALNAARDSGQISASEYGYKMIQLNNERSKSINDLTAEQKALNDSMGELNAQIDAGVEKRQMISDEFDEMAAAAGTVEEATDSAAESLDGIGTEAGEAAAELDVAAQTIEEKYQELYESAYQSLTGQGQLWQEYTLETEHSTAELQANLAEQTSFYNTWASDLETVWAYAVQTGDASTMAMVQQLAGMGEDGAGHVHDLAVAISDENYDIVNSFGDTVGNLQSAQSETASILAQIEGNMVETSNGLVYTSEYTGQQIKTNVASAGQNAQSTWNSSMQGIEQTTRSSMGNVQSETQAGMDSAQTSVSNAAGPMESAAINVFAGVQAQANMAAGNMRGFGSDAVSNFESGMWSGQYSLQSAAGYIASSALSPLQDSLSAYYWGMDMANSFANGIWAGYGAAVSAAYAIANAVYSILHHSTPDKGPLRGDDKWGAELAENFANSMAEKAGLVQKAAGTLANAAVIKNLNSANAFGLSSTSGSGTSIAGDDITINVYASDGMNVKQLADEVSYRLALTQRQKASAYA